MAAPGLSHWTMSSTTISMPRAQERTCPGPGLAGAVGHLEDGHVPCWAPRRGMLVAASGPARLWSQPLDISPPCPCPVPRNGHVPWAGLGRGCGAPEGWTCPLLGAKAGRAGRSEWTCPPLVSTTGHITTMSMPCAQEWTCPVGRAGPGLRRTGRMDMSFLGGNAGRAGSQRVHMSSPSSGQVLPDLQPLDMCPVCPPAAAKDGHVPLGVRPGCGTPAARRCPCRRRC